jgi:general secretion pathway protein C
MKYLFALINLILLSGSAFFCIDIFQKTVFKDPSFISDIKPLDGGTADLVQNQEGAGVKQNSYDIIVQRNLFKVQIERKEESDNESSHSTEKLEPTTLSLTLWGTVTGGSELYAVIEDKLSRLQALYEEGDLIQDATIKKIMKKEIILTFQGKDQVLEMETDPGKSGPIKKSGEIQIPGKAPLIQTFPSTPGNTGDIMTQIKFRPFFTKGSPDGVMVYAIKPDSVFNQIGLRNGDIVKAINSASIASVEDAFSFLSDMERTDAVRVTLIRNGEIKEISFNSGQLEGLEQGGNQEIKQEILTEAQDKGEDQSPKDIELENAENSEDKNKGEE